MIKKSTEQIQSNELTQYMSCYTSESVYTCVFMYAIHRPVMITQSAQDPTTSAQRAWDPSCTCFTPAWTHLWTPQRLHQTQVCESLALLPTMCRVPTASVTHTCNCKRWINKLSLGKVIKSLC